MLSLIRDQNGRLSASKLWTNIAYGVSTYIVIERTHDMTWDFLLVYMAVVGGSEIAKKFLTMHYGREEKSNEASTIKPVSNPTKIP